MAERSLGFQPPDLRAEQAIENLRQLGRSEPQSWPRAPVRTPRTRLAQICQVVGVPDFNVTAEILFRHCCKPGRQGVRAIINTACLTWQTRGELLPAVVVEMFERQVNRHGFAYVLVKAWHNSGGTMHRAAGSMERLVEMFRYARMDDIQLPFLKPFCGIPAVADTFTAWRGGRGTPEEVAARGPSWSLRYWPATYFALRTEAYANKLLGPPVILRREVRREDAIAWLQANDEVILPNLGHYEVATADEAEIQAAYDAGKDELVRVEAEADAWVRKMRSMSEDEALQGWTGEAA